MKIRFLTSRNKEVDRLINLYENYQWFIDNTFPIIVPKFLKSIYKKFGDKNYGKEIFKKFLQKEIKIIYSQKKYSKTINSVKKRWLKIEKDFFGTLEKLGFKSKKVFHCYISLYGPGGQFKYPNLITLRSANNADLNEATANIAHEIIHLLIYKKTEKINLKYEQVEGIVDLFFIETELKNIFPHYKKQTIAKHDTRLFKKFFSKSFRL